MIPPIVAVRPIAAVLFPASLTIVIVCELPASACSLIQSAAFSLAVIIARPPSANKSLPSAQRNPIPPAVASNNIEPAP